MRLLNKRQFSKVLSKSTPLNGNYLLIKYVKTQYNSQVGIAASKKFGNAVKRNYFKRVVRETFRTSPFTHGCSFIVYPKVRIEKHYEYKNELLSLLHDALDG